MGQVTAPLLQLMVFYFYGDAQWEDHHLRIVIFVGVCTQAAAVLSSLLLSERYALRQSSEAAQETIKRDDLGETGEGAPEEEAATEQVDVIYDGNKAQHLRWSIFVYDMFRVLFGGLAVKYFGLFFTVGSAPGEGYQMSPVHFSLLMAGNRLGNALCTVLAGSLASRFQSRGVVIFVMLTLCDAGNLMLAYGAGPALLSLDIGGFVLRSCTLMSIFGIKKSLLMDHTPKRHRGRSCTHLFKDTASKCSFQHFSLLGMWTSIDDLQSSFWSGTAAVGGILIEHKGFRFNFMVMAWGFVAATLVWTNVVRLFQS
jgi:hypothetical protein